MSEKEDNAERKKKRQTTSFSFLVARTLRHPKDSDSPEASRRHDVGHRGRGGGGGAAAAAGEEARPVAAAVRPAGPGRREPGGGGSGGSGRRGVGDGGLGDREAVEEGRSDPEGVAGPPGPGLDVLAARVHHHGEQQARRVEGLRQLRGIQVRTSTSLSLSLSLSLSIDFGMWTPCCAVDFRFLIRLERKRTSPKS